MRPRVLASRRAAASTITVRGNPRLKESAIMPIPTRILTMCLLASFLFAGQHTQAQYATEWSNEPSIDQISRTFLRMACCSRPT